MGKAKAPQKFRTIRLKTLAFVIPSVVSCVALVIGFGLSFNWIYREKQRDLRALQSAEMEIRYLNAIDALKRIDRDVGHEKSIARFMQEKTTYRSIKGQLAAQLPLSTLSHVKDRDLTIAEIGGRSYLARRINGVIDVYSMDEVLPVEQWSQKALVYVVNRKGELIYSSNPKLDANKMLRRFPVQEFVRSSINRGQIHYEDQTGMMIMAYHFVIETLDIAVFTEINETAVLRGIHQITKALLIITLVCAAFVIVLLRVGYGFQRKGLIDQVTHISYFGSGRIFYGSKPCRIEELNNLHHLSVNTFEAIVRRQEESQKSALKVIPGG